MQIFLDAVFYSLILILMTYEEAKESYNNPIS